jgi:hypothetical protein
MKTSGYDVLDAYTLEELRRRFLASDVRDRIRLLKRFAYRLPYEIATLAVEDSNPEIRQWIARHDTSAMT